MKNQKKGKLYLIPTPLSPDSLDKIVTPDMAQIITGLDYFLVENLRTARRFVSSLKLGKVIEELHFEVLDKKTASKDIQRLCAPLTKGKDIGVMSEAGCPGIADPGNLAVAFAHKQGYEVAPLVGPSSIFMALMASGFNGQSFAFHGYLPIDKQKRVQAIKALEKELVRSNQTQIFMETPFRNDHLFADLIRTCMPNTKLCVARDVTGESELIQAHTIKEWKSKTPNLHKAPTIFLLGS